MSFHNTTLGILFESHSATLTSGGSKGGVPARAPPTDQNFLDFMQFFGKFDKIVCWRPPRWLAPPPMGNPGSAPADLFYFVDWAFFIMWNIGGSKARRQGRPPPRVKILSFSCSFQQKMCKIIPI